MFFTIHVGSAAFYVLSFSVSSVLEDLTLAGNYFFYSLALAPF
jgi:hypothetical protein